MWRHLMFAFHENLTKPDDKGCIGAPDIVVEILPLSNNKKELKNKYEVYEESGIREYRIISPRDKTFFRYIMNEYGKYQPTHLLTMGDIVTTAIRPALSRTRKTYLKIELVLPRKVLSKFSI